MSNLVVTRDGIPDTRHLTARCWANRKLVQEANAQRYLAHGGEVTLSVDGIGDPTNPLVAEWV